MARAADDENGKSLWVTLAISWVRLADHAARANGEQTVSSGARIDAADPAPSKAATEIENGPV
jgi:hypothetical protein